MKTHQNRLWFILAAVISTALLVGGVGVTWHRSHNRNSDKPASSTAKTPVSDVTANSTQSPVPGTDKQQNPVTSRQPLTAPNGTFVSNHHPSLSGQNSNLEQSTCNTLPGASCDIEFSKDGVTKSLGLKQADSSGAVYWTWKLQDVGLTQGTWQTTARATLNGETKTAQDPLALTIQP